MNPTEDIDQMVEPFANDYTRSLAEKCVDQLNLLVESFDIADNQIMKLSKVVIIMIALYLNMTRNEAFIV